VEVDELDAAGVEDDVLVGVNGGGNEVMLVNVEADEASGWRILRHGAMLLYE
jgi:hypothetical protein